MNVFPMHQDQNGIFLERSSQMAFLQLLCAGHDAGICAKLWDNGNTYFRNMHVEGPRLGFCVGSNNKVVRFGAYQEGDANDIAYGGQSDIFSCHDTFTSLTQTQSTWVYTGTLSTPVTYCY